MTVKICVGSSCHLKGAPQIVEQLQSLLAQYDLEAKVDLGGSFCFGQCNRDGVTIQVDDEIFTGLTPETFSEFFHTHILKG